MEPPPPLLHNARVLEYAIFDATVRRTEVKRIDAFPWVPKPITALAICQGRVPGDMNEVYLFYCDAERSIERVQIWKSPQSTETHPLPRRDAVRRQRGEVGERLAELRPLPSPW